MDLVRQMVGKHLSNPRSIILLAYDDFQSDRTPLTDVRAVVPVNVDIATQEIIQMAEYADPHASVQPVLQSVCLDSSTLAA